MIRKKISEVLKGGLFTDGDWINSKDQDPDGEIRLIQLADIGDGVFINKSSRYINNATAKRLKCTFLKKGDVLVARMPDPLGRSCIFPLEGYQKYITAVDVCILRPDEEKVSNSYLSHMINSPFNRSEIERQSTGTTRKRITRKRLGNLEIPFPPLKTQEHIASILDDAAALRDKTAQLLEEYNLLAQSIFLEMFGDRYKFEEKELGKIITLLNSKRIPVKASDRANMQGEYPYYGASGIIDYVDEFLFDETCLLIGEDGANLISRSTPIAFIASGRYWVNNHAHVISKKSNINIIYLMYYINSINLEPYITGSAQPKLNATNLRKIPVPIPSKILQNEFAEKIALIEQQKELVRQELKESEDLFNCLLQKAFKGELVPESQEI